MRRSKPGVGASATPSWIKPQLCQLVKQAPAGDGWAHEIKFDGYRMHAHIEGDRVRLLTRTGLDWSHKYPGTVEALRLLGVGQAYLDGELCGVRPDGVTSFGLMQSASDGDIEAELVYFAFDLLHLNGSNLAGAPLLERKSALDRLLAGASPRLRLSDHIIGGGEAFYRHACKAGLEGVVSKRIDRPYRPGNRGDWVKTKCLNREEFVVIGWTDPEGRRSKIGALLLGYHTPEGRLVYAGRVGAGLTEDELRALWTRMQPFAVGKMPVDVPPPRASRFGSPLELSRVHWVRPELVVEVSYLAWTGDNLLRQVTYEGLREDKPAAEVIRAIPHTK